MEKTRRRNSFCPLKRPSVTVNALSPVPEADMLYRTESYFLCTRSCVGVWEWVLVRRIREKRKEIRVSLFVEVYDAKRPAEIYSFIDRSNNFSFLNVCPECLFP